MIIDIEAQKDTSSIKRLIRRGIYYVSRMISEQYGTEFFNDEYEKIKKVISIWICPSTAKYKANSIVQWRSITEPVYGGFKIDEEASDLMRVIIVNLEDESKRDKTENQIIRLLSVYLSDEKTPEEKKKILEKEFDIEMTEEMEKEVREMYSMSQALKDKTWQEASIRFATNLLKDAKPISYVAKMTELSEDAVRSTSEGLKKTAKD